MRKYLSILCTIISLLLITSITVYAKSLKSTVESDRTFTLTIENKEVVVNLPKDFPDMDEAFNRNERCWDADLCAATFCLSIVPKHDHVRFFYSDNNVVALGLSITAPKEFRWWLYEKGILTEVSYEILFNKFGKKSEEK